MRIASGALVAGAVLALALPAVGQTEGAAQNGLQNGPKYQIMRADNERVWRLNTETGEIAVCHMEGARMVCASSGETIERSKQTPEDLEKARERERTAEREDKFAMMDRLMVLFERLMKMVSELKPDGAQPTR